MVGQGGPPPRALVVTTDCSRATLLDNAANSSSPTWTSNSVRQVRSLSLPVFGSASARSSFSLHKARSARTRRERWALDDAPDDDRSGRREAVVAGESNWTHSLTGGNRHILPTREHPVKALSKVSSTPTFGLRCSGRLLRRHWCSHVRLGPQPATAALLRTYARSEAVNSTISGGSTEKSQ
jgi:hypothetical protein